MNYQKLSDYMQSEHGVILLETDMQEIVNIVREMDDPKHPLKDENDELYDLASISEEDKGKICEAWVKTTGDLGMATFYAVGLNKGIEAQLINDVNGDAFKLSFTKVHQETPELHPSITHLSTDKPLSEETIGIVNKMAEKASKTTI